MVHDLETGSGLSFGLIHPRPGPFTGGHPDRVVTTATAMATMDTGAPMRRRRPGAAPLICVFGRLPMACSSS
jgi:hypothetical protein